MDKLDLETFGDIIDEFLEKTEGKMLITMPEGTQEVTLEDNLGTSSVIQFYFLLQAINTASKTMCKDMGLDRTSEEWKKVVDELLKMMKEELLEEDDGTDL